MQNNGSSVQNQVQNALHVFHMFDGDRQSIPSRHIAVAYGEYWYFYFQLG